MNLYGAWLQSITQDWKQLRSIYRHSNDLEALFLYPEKQCDKLTISDDLKTRIKDSANSRYLDELIAKMNRLGVSFVLHDEEAFPKKLAECSDAPFGLYVQGELPSESKPKISIVGTRNCTNYGREIATYFSEVLSEAGIMIVSGLAMGVDGIAHKAAIGTTGNTMAVLGSGIGTSYPKENWGIYHELVKQGGCVVSEYPPGSPPSKHHFPNRNRIISGLSDGVLVVEAREKSGTLITVDRALEQGKDVYVIPGRIDDINSKGCNNLIKQGAQLVTEPDEILSDILLKYPFFAAENELRSEPANADLSMKTELFLGIASEKKMVYSCLRLDLKHFDVLVKETKLHPVILAEILSELEDMGLAKQPCPNYFTRPYRG